MISAASFAASARAATERAEPLPDDVAAYAALGQAIADDLQLRSLAWSDAEFEAFITGLRAGFRGQQYSLSAAAKEQFNVIGSSIAEAQTKAKNAPASEPTANTAATTTVAKASKYLEQARTQLKFEQLPSGLLYRVGRYGSGPRPTPTDVVVISLKAAIPEIDASIPQLGMKHARVNVADLMPGLVEAVQILALEGSGLFLVPPELSFGNGKWPEGVQPGSLLLFAVELHDIEPADTAR